MQAWGTDVAALRHYWQAAHDPGFARITYGNGLWGSTHDGWTRLGALRRPHAARPPRPGRHILRPALAVSDPEARPPGLARDHGTGRARPRRFRAARKVKAGDGLFAATLVGAPDAVAARIVQYAAAGATNLVFGFADFPATRMIEAFAERVLPGLATHR